MWYVQLLLQMHTSRTRAGVLRPLKQSTRQKLLQMPIMNVHILRILHILYALRILLRTTCAILIAGEIASRSATLRNAPNLIKLTVVVD